jgi:hypothetical protein
MPTEEIPIYHFATIKLQTLETLVKLKRKFSTAGFNTWFNADIQVTAEDKIFFEHLINNHCYLIESYNEEELKIKFIAPILNRIKFTNIEYEIRDFYEAKITYETDHFILTGVTDFLVAKGLEYPKTPYFFIQEFKKSIKNDNPRPQLLAELIVAIELNQFNSLKGAYIIGENWNFLILEKLETHHYQYSISQTLNATHLDGLEQIYKNLLFVQQEIIELFQ